MKFIFCLLLCVCFNKNADAQTGKIESNIIDSTKMIQIVEASCGQCQFKMAGKGCSLAVRINGNPYFVDGTDIDRHGDAHAADGFCEAIRKAEVQGEIVNGRFKASYFNLIDIKE